MKNIELLAPAGSMESLIAAVNGGADAVYLGGAKFGARKSAVNFDEAQMQLAVQFCHERNVDVYVTVNTLIKDEEWHSFEAYIQFLYEVGVDAVIVQDLGALHFVRTHYPDFECHASTQMTLHNTWDVAWAETEGIDRVVLARELGVADFKEIRQASSLPLEIFVHGALCIAYSGHCLLSSYIGGRSGNRGGCAQPCRKAYELMDWETGKSILTEEGVYLMSPRDINGQSVLSEITALEPVSLKLEGRMKGPDYVYTVVKSYREALMGETDQSKLYQVFNRDFSEAYFNGKNYTQLMNLTVPSQYGFEVGTATDFNGQRLTLKLTSPLNKGDEIQCRFRTHTLGTRCDEIYVGGQRVSTADAGTVVSVPFKHKVPKNMRFYKTYDANFIRKAEVDSQREVARHALTLTFELKAGTKAQLIGQVGEITVTCQSSQLPETALKVAVTEDKVLQQLSKLGGTPFYLEKASVDVAPGLSFPMSELNALRREVCEGLLAKISERHLNRSIRKVQKAALDTVLQNETYYLYFSDVITLKEAIEKNSASERFVYVLEDLKGFAENIDYCVAHGVYLGLPKIIRNSEMKAYKQLIETQGKLIKGFALSHIGQLEAIKDLEAPLWIANESMPCFNKETFAYLVEKGASAVFASVEWPYSKHIELVGAFVYGRVPLMTSEYCPVGKVLHNKHKCGACANRRFALKDMEGTVYPLDLNPAACRMTLYSDKIYYGLDQLNALKSKGQKHFKLDFRNATTVEVESVIGALTHCKSAIAFKPTIHTRGRLLNGVD